MQKQTMKYERKEKNNTPDTVNDVKELVYM